MDNPNITIIELNTGAGGITLGLKYAEDFENIVTVLDNKHCYATYSKHFKQNNVILSEIENLDFTTYAEDNIDVIWASLPAEPYLTGYSIKLAKSDPRNEMFFNYCRIIKEVKPKMFIFDCIKGLFIKESGILYQVMKTYMEKMGYVIEEKLLNAWNYDVAQKRERLIIVGILQSEYDLRKDNGIYFKFPDASPNKKLVLRDVIGQEYVAYDPGDVSTYSKDKTAILDLVPPGGCWVDLPDDIKKTYMGGSFNKSGGKRGMAKRLSWDEPCPTLTTSPVQKQTERCHPTYTRPLTVYEYKLIQSFPKNYDFEGSIINQYKQIGNSMPPNFVKYIGGSIKNYIYMLPT